MCVLKSYICVLRALFAATKDLTFGYLSLKQGDILTYLHLAFLSVRNRCPFPTQRMDHASIHRDALGNYLYSNGRKTKLNSVRPVSLHGTFNYENYIFNLRYENSDIYRQMLKGVAKSSTQRKLSAQTKLPVVVQ